MKASLLGLAFQVLSELGTSCSMQMAMSKLQEQKEAKTARCSTGWQVGEYGTAP